jgi:ATP-dependent Clp protease ATP-binding subunit ClpC
MPEPFDRFANPTRRVLMFAQDEGQRLNHGYLGSEHLLLGIMRERQSAAARLLASLGADLPKARGRVTAIVGQGLQPCAGEVVLALTAQHVIEFAVDEAHQLGQEDIRAEHVLLGVIRERAGIGAAVLEDLGVNLNDVHHQVQQILQILGHRGQRDEPTA